MPRLYHTKSKTGCARCRARRVKCDEALPICGGCQRHQVNCTYDRPPLGSKPSGSAQASTDVTQLSMSQQPDLCESRERRYRELWLLHYFAVEVSRTIPGTCHPEILHLWATDAPRLALTYEPLLNALLSFTIQAAQNLQSPEPPPEGLSHFREYYLQLTLREHRNGVEALNRHNTDAVGLTSTTIALDAFAAVQHRQIPKPYQPPMEWLHLSRGTREVFTAVRHVVREDPNSKLKAMLNFGEGLFKLYNPEPEDDYLNAFDYLVDSMDEEARRGEDGEAYRHASRYIAHVWAEQQAGEHILAVSRRLLSIAMLMKPRFVQLLWACESRALAVLAHFFAVGIRCSELWWVGEGPCREIVAIRDHLGAAWAREMSWPLKMVEEQRAKHGGERMVDEWAHIST